MTLYTIYIINYSLQYQLIRTLFRGTNCILREETQKNYVFISWATEVGRRGGGLTLKRTKKNLLFHKRKNIDRPRLIQMSKLQMFIFSLFSIFLIIWVKVNSFDCRPPVPVEAEDRGCRPWRCSCGLCRCGTGWPPRDQGRDPALSEQSPWLGD